MNEKTGRIPFTSLCAAFPSHKHPVMRPNQRLFFEHVAKHPQAIGEIPPGEGKTAIEYAILKAAATAGRKPLFLITPNKTILNQIKLEYPELTAVMGRNEHNCGYYEDEETFRSDLPLGATEFRADEIACSFLKDCPHRVDTETGETHEEGAEHCPYLDGIYRARRAPIVLSTMAFYLFDQLFVHRWEKPKALVIDEAHRMAEVVRQCLSYDITDYHLKRAMALLEKLGADDEVKKLNAFFKAFIRISKKKEVWKPTLLEDEELRDLIAFLEAVNPATLEGKLAKAIRDGAVDVGAERETLKKVEVLVRDIRRYLHSFEYSLPGEKRGPLNYTYAFRKDEKAEGERVEHRLTVKSHYVAPLIRKILGEETVSLSATIGDPEVFSFETGIEGEFLSLLSSFPAKNARIYMPLDTPNLAFSKRKPGDVRRWLRIIARTLAELGKAGIRSLMIVVSNEERETFKLLAEEEGLDAVNYGNGITAREAAEMFRSGKGTTLVGTAGNYAEGVDLPRSIAPLIVAWRPGYPSPEDPAALFEERRFRTQRWKLWHWRVAISSLQVRGRNIRSAEDIGVTIFVSQQFRNVVFAALPKALREYYDGDKKFADAVAEIKELVS